VAPGLSDPVHAAVSRSAQTMGKTKVALSPGRRRASDQDEHHRHLDFCSARGEREANRQHSRQYTRQ
jgi:hypothetical protein